MKLPTIAYTVLQKGREGGGGQRRGGGGEGEERKKKGRNGKKEGRSLINTASITKSSKKNLF